jgi:nifR3 family TIM-barrel protein
MAGITDCVFRAIAARHGAGLTFSEMVSAKSLVYGNKNTFRLLENDCGVRPWAVQLFGHEPDIMAEAIRRLADVPFDIVNINMGCPMPKVVNNGDGAALMKDPALAGRVIGAAVHASPRPVTVKIRLGFSPSAKNAVELARVAWESGAAQVIVHGRTRDQYYAGHADWDEISAVKSSVSVPVIGNGDIFTPEDAAFRLKTSGCDGIMIARGALGNPWIFSRTAEYVKTGVLPPPPQRETVIEAAIAHLRAVAARKNVEEERLPSGFVRIDEMRKHLSWYTKGMPGSADLRRRINLARSADEMEAILKGETPS